MLEYILTVVVCLVIFVGFFLVSFFMFIAIVGKVEKRKKRKNFYCYNCEIEMPVKEKSGSFYCSNCNLYHGTKV